MIIKELIKFRNLSENNKKFFLPNNPNFHHKNENDNLLSNNENIDIKKEINKYIVSEKHQLITNINNLKEEEKKCINTQKDLNAIKSNNNVLIDEINKLTDKRKTDPEIIEKFKYYENKSHEAILEKQNYEKKIEEIQDTILTIQNYLTSENEKIKKNENKINEEINILNILLITNNYSSFSSVSLSLIFFPTSTFNFVFFSVFSISSFDIVSSSE